MLDHITDLLQIALLTTIGLLKAILTHTLEKGWIAREGNYYINGLSNYNESDLYFLNNCNESKIDDTSTILC